jgi:nucleoside-diphosphate-sugar epimerase
MRILVTGSGGYIGAVLVNALLKHNYEVIAVDNLMYGQTSLLGFVGNPLFTFYKHDVRNSWNNLTRTLDVVDVIIPLAGIVGAPACKQNLSLSMTVNETVVCRLASFQKAKIIYPNTNSGYGTKSGTRYCTEETKLEPISEYGIQKVRTEQFLLQNHGNTVSFRLATVFGVSPRMRWDLLVNGLVYDAMKHRYLVLYEPHAKRNYVHVKDVVNCFIYALDNWDNMVGQAYNLGLDNANLSKAELAKLVQKFTDCEIFLSPRKTDPDKRNYIVSNKKLKEAGFSAMYTLEDGIQELMTAYEMMSKHEMWRNV